MLLKNVEYWDKSEEEMKAMDSYGMYPPRIKLETYPSVKYQVTEAIFNFNIFEQLKTILTTEEGKFSTHIY